MIEKINLLIEHIKPFFEQDNSGHDWFHIQRVYENALYIQSFEGGDPEVVALTALLHDISDHKLNGGHMNKGGEEAAKVLRQLEYDPVIIDRVSALIDHISYKGSHVADKAICIEQQIVQDADRLDAIGAIGIARAFAYGGHKDRPMYTPHIQPEIHDSFEKYANAKSHTINHFYEKLLLLKDRMHTETGKRMAQERHDFMELFLKQFYKEWNSEN